MIIILRKKLKIVFSLMLAGFILAMGSVAYASGNRTVSCHPGEVFTVYFDSMGGSEISAVQVTYGDKLSRPADPQYAGHTFEGWYKDTCYSYKWDFKNDKVQEYLTLYAKWSDTASEDPGDDNDSDDEDTGDGTLSAPEGLTAASESYNSILLTWESDGDEDGFEIYAATSADGEYDLLDTVEDPEYIDSGLKTNKTYYYKVRAYAETDEDTQYSDFTPVVSAKPVPAAPESIKAVKSKGTYIIKWSKVRGATKYEVFRSTAQDGNYKKISTVGTKSYTCKSLKAGTTYYFKVRAYCLVKGKKVYGDFSDTVSVNKE